MTRALSTFETLVLAEIKAAGARGIALARVSDAPTARRLVEIGAARIVKNTLDPAAVAKVVAL